MRHRTLGRTGSLVSVIGFGASPLGDVFHLTNPKESERAVHQAVDQGIDLFDVSPYYGLTLAERRLGEALAGRRQRVFLATKCGRYGEESFDFSSRRMKATIDESLRRLQTDYVDLLQAHDVEFAEPQHIIEETIPALREIQRQGKTRFIGITGYPAALLAEIALKAPVDTILSYCRYNLMITDMDQLLTPVAERESIGLINASPLHMGILTDGGAPAWHPAPQTVKDAGRRIVDLCRSHRMDPAIVALRFCLDHPYVASTLVGMSKPSHVESNLRALEIEIDSELLRAIEEVVAPVKDTVWASGIDFGSESWF